MLDAKEELGTIGERVRRLEARKKTTRVKNAVQAVEMLISPLGLKDKMKSLKAQPGGGAAPSEDRAEVMLEDLTLNELVNLLHTLKSSRTLMLTRKARIRTSFENPERLNVTLTLSLIKAE